jgi:hypothetical protein
VWDLAHGKRLSTIQQYTHTSYSSIHTFPLSSQSNKQKAVIDNLDFAIEDIDSDIVDLAEKKLAFLNSWDDKVAGLYGAKKSRVRGKVAALDKMDEINLHKEAVGYMLTFSGTKVYATQSLEETRDALGLTDANKVYGLQFRPSLKTIYKLYNLGLAEHPEFEGSYPSENNDFVGEIVTGKDTNKIGVLHARLIQYLKVPGCRATEAPSLKEPPSLKGNVAMPPFPKEPPSLKGNVAMPPFLKEPSSLKSNVAVMIQSPVEKEKRRAEILAELALLDADASEARYYR